MDIYTRQVIKVRFAYPKRGYTHHQETAAAHLTEGEVYTVTRTKVGSWHAYVFLEEVPGLAFNSVMFEQEGAP